MRQKVGTGRYITITFQRGGDYPPPLTFFQSPNKIAGTGLITQLALQLIQ